MNKISENINFKSLYERGVWELNLNYTEEEKSSEELYKLFLSEEQLTLESLHEKFNEYFTENIIDRDIIDFLYDEYVEITVQNNSQYKVGDIVYKISDYHTRQSYGICIIGFDIDKYEKTIEEDDEGQPELPGWIIKQLRKNMVTYDRVNYEMNHIMLENQDEILDVLPFVCYSIMDRDPILELTD